MSLNKAWLVVTAAVMMAACSKSPEKKPEQPVRAITVPVAVSAIEEVPDVQEVTGTVRARVSATLAAKVSGYVRDVRVRQGDTVRAGQPLVDIDAAELDAAYRSAAAAKQEVSSATEEVEHSIAVAKANLDLAAATHKRMSTLYEKKSISDQEFDEASARFKAAQASYEAAASKRGQLASRAQQADQAIRTATITKGYSVVTAPFTGTVVERRAEPGALAMPGMPLLVVEQAGAYRLEANVPESLLRFVKRGQKMPVKLDVLDAVVQASVDELAPMVDAETRTAVVKFALPSRPELRSGMFGRIPIMKGQTQRLTVPASAVQEDGQVTSLFVVEGNHAHRRLITVGRTYDGKAEILAGLQAGEKFVTKVPPGLCDGCLVEVR